MNTAYIPQSSQYPQPKQAKPAKPTQGKLVWICGGQETVLATGPFPFLQSQRTKYKNDPSFTGGVLKLRYL